MKPLVNITSEPVNKITKIVASPSFEQGPDRVKSTAISSMSPLPTVRFTGKQADDLTGRKAGRFLVVGFAMWRSKDKTNAARWVVRCVCGRYQHMTSKAIKRAHESNMCVECRQTQFLRRMETSSEKQYFKTFKR